MNKFILAAKALTSKMSLTKRMSVKTIARDILPSALNNVHDLNEIKMEKNGTACAFIPKRERE